MTVHPCNLFFDNFLAGVICSPPRDSADWEILENSHPWEQLLSTPSSFAAVVVRHGFLDVSERLSCCSFGDVFLANHFHIPLSPAPTGVSSTHSTLPHTAASQQVALEITELHLKSPIASLLLENSTLQPGARFSLGKVRSQGKGWTRKATVLVKSWHSNEFPEFQLGESDPLLHPFQPSTSAARSREHWG